MSVVSSVRCCFAIATNARASAGSSTADAAASERVAVLVSGRICADFVDSES